MLRELLSPSIDRGRGLFRLSGGRRADRRARGQPHRRHRPAADAAQPRDLGSHVPRRRARRPTSPTSSRRRRGVKILYVCHRFPFPPKRGGKIRPFNMIRHLSASHEVTVASLARSDEEAQGRGGHRGALRALRDGRSPQSGPGGADGRAAADRRRRRRSAISIRRSSRVASTRCSPANALRPDLRALLVGRATMSRTSRGMPKILDFGDMDSQKWLEYARYKPFPLVARLSARRRARSSAPEKRLARALRPVHGDDARRMGDARELSHRVADRLVSERRRQRLFRTGRRAVRSRHHRVRRTDGLLPEPGMHVRFLRARRCRCCDARRPALKLLIVGADPSPRRAAARRSCPASRSRVRCPTSGRTCAARR